MSLQNRRQPPSAAHGLRVPNEMATAPARISGRQLWEALGFRNQNAFLAARAAGWRELRLYPLPGRAHGVFARADELGAYLARRQRDLAANDDTDQ